MYIFQCCYHMKLTRNKLYHWLLNTHVAYATYTIRTHSMFVFIFVACHNLSQTFPYQEHRNKLHTHMSKFNNCYFIHDKRVPWLLIHKFFHSLLKNKTERRNKESSGVIDNVSQHILVEGGVPPLPLDRWGLHPLLASGVVQCCAMKTFSHQAIYWV